MRPLLVLALCLFGLGLAGRSHADTPCQAWTSGDRDALLAHAPPRIAELFRQEAAAFFGESVYSHDYGAASVLVGVARVGSVWRITFDYNAVTGPRRLTLVYGDDPNAPGDLIEGAPGLPTWCGGAGALPSLTAFAPRPRQPSLGGFSEGAGEPVSFPQDVPPVVLAQLSRDNPNEFGQRGQLVVSVGGGLHGVWRCGRRWTIVFSTAGEVNAGPLTVTYEVSPDGRSVQSIGPIFCEQTLNPPPELSEVDPWTITVSEWEPPQGFSPAAVAPASYVLHPAAYAEFNDIGGEAVSFPAAVPQPVLERLSTDNPDDFGPNGDVLLNWEGGGVESVTRCGRRWSIKYRRGGIVSTGPWIAAYELSADGLSAAPAPIRVFCEGADEPQPDPSRLNSPSARPIVGVPSVRWYVAEVYSWRGQFAGVRLFVGPVQSIAGAPPARGHALTVRMPNTRFMGERLIVLESTEGAQSEVLDWRYPGDALCVPDRLLRDPALQAAFARWRFSPPRCSAAPHD